MHGYTHLADNLGFHTSQHCGVIADAPGACAGAAWTTSTAARPQVMVCLGNSTDLIIMVTKEKISSLLSELPVDRSPRGIVILVFAAVSPN